MSAHASSPVSFKIDGTRTVGLPVVSAEGYRGGMRRVALSLSVACASCGSPHATVNRPGPSEAMEMAEPSPKVRVLPPEWEEKVAADPHWPENVLLMQVELARLGYFKRPFVPEMDERTIAAFQEYKRDAGLPGGDSILDPALMKRMHDDGEALLQPVGLYPYSFQDFGDFVDVQGTWTGVGQSLAYPEQTSTITCIRRLGVCFEALARLSEDHVLLSSLAIVHNVDEWSDREVTTIGDQAACTASITRFNRVTKRVSRTRTTTNTDGICATTQPEDFHVQMVDGKEVWQDLYKDYEDRRRRVLGLPETGP